MRLCPSGSLLPSLLLAPALAWGQPYAFVTSGAEDAVAVLDVGQDVLLGQIPLDGTPIACALSANGRLWVTRTQSNTVTLIDTNTGASSTFPVGQRPTGVAVVPAGNLAFVANTGSDSVSAVSGAATQEIPVGRSPIAVALGGTRVYVANWGDGSVSVISAGAVIATIPVGKLPAGLAVDEAGGRLYVANFFDDTVSVVDTTSLSVVATIPVARAPRGLAVDPVAGRLYVAGFQDGGIQVIATATGQVLLEGPSWGENPVDLALGPGNQRLYVTHLEEGKGITVLDPTSLAPLGSIEAPTAPLTLAGFGLQAPRLPLRRPAAPAGPLPAHRASAVRRRPRPAASPQGVTIGDTEFDPLDWQVSEQQGTQTTVQNPVSGNPGAWRETTHSGAAFACHEYVAQSYDPASGPIATIDVAWDRRLYESSGSVEERAAVFQGGVPYVETTAHPFSNQLWQSTSVSGLDAQSFYHDPEGHPSFDGGGALTFGYCRGTTGGNITHGIDNFQVTLVPPPTGGGLLEFEVSGDFVIAGSTAQEVVRRNVSTQGDVGVHVSFDGPGTIVSGGDLTWPDGDASPRLVTIQLTGVPQVFAGRLSLGAPTGGASLGLGDMTILVAPPNAIGAFALLLEGLLLGALSPGWLLVLGVTGLACCARRGRRGRSA